MGLHLRWADAGADSQAGLYLDRLTDLADDRLSALTPFFDADEAVAVNLGWKLLKQVVGQVEEGLVHADFGNTRVEALKNSHDCQDGND